MIKENIEKQASPIALALGLAAGLGGLGYGAYKYAKGAGQQRQGESFNRTMQLMNMMRGMQRPQGFGSYGGGMGTLPAGVTPGMARDSYAQARERARIYLERNNMSETDDPTEPEYYQMKWRPMPGMSMKQLRGRPIYF